MKRSFEEMSLEVGTLPTSILACISMPIRFIPVDIAVAREEYEEFQLAEAGEIIVNSESVIPLDDFLF
jgi:hypothetical protein